jgi:hypothetical protein
MSENTEDKHLEEASKRFYENERPFSIADQQPSFAPIMALCREYMVEAMLDGSEAAGEWPLKVVADILDIGCEEALGAGAHAYAVLARKDAMSEPPMEIGFEAIWDAVVAFEDPASESGEAFSEEEEKLPGLLPLLTAIASGTLADLMKNHPVLVPAENVLGRLIWENVQRGAWAEFSYARQLSS